MDGSIGSKQSPNIRETAEESVMRTLGSELIGLKKRIKDVLKSLSFPSPDKSDGSKTPARSNDKLTAYINDVQEMYADVVEIGKRVKKL